MSALSPEDLAQLQALGISAEEAQRQLTLLSGPPPRAVLARPCRIGDGIERLEERDLHRLLVEGATCAAAGRVSLFVPASGAATRMFEALIACSAQGEATIDSLRHDAGAGDRAAADTLRFLAHRHEFAFSAELARSCVDAGLAEGDIAGVLRRLLGRPGLGLADLPKALIPFHDSEHGARTALEEQLVEAAAYATDEGRTCRLHFTLAPEHVPGVRAMLDAGLAAHERRLGVHFELSFSSQSRATDTLAIDLGANPFRNADGTLLLRPGGHGALLRNLNELGAQGADVVVLKNIDNVVPDRAKDLTVRWKRILIGLLARRQRLAFEHVRRLESDEVGREDLAAAQSFAEQDLGFRPSAALRSATFEERRRRLLAWLDRPLRVCGVVRNEGQPGGGPFWVEDRRGELTPQIVESAQVDPDSETQLETWSSSTHFNPVDIVCGLRDSEGHAYDLHRYADPSAAFVAAKSNGGRRLKALEHPGLWNGGMAYWNTLFVEVPGETFAPVKSILDLLRPEHRS